MHQHVGDLVPLAPPLPPGNPCLLHTRVAEFELSRSADVQVTAPMTTSVPPEIVTVDLFSLSRVKMRMICVVR